MSLKNLLKGSVAYLFGQSTNGAPIQKPQQSSEDTNSIKISDILVAQEAVLQMKDMTQIFLSIEGACAKACSTSGSPEAQSMIVGTSEILENNLSSYVHISQKLESIHRNSCIAGHVDLATFQPSIVSITAQFSSVLTACPKHLSAVEELQKTGLYDGADDLRSRVKTAMGKALDLSAQLHAIVYKSFNFETASAAEAGTVSRQP